MSASAQLLILSLGLYFFSLLVAFLLRFAMKKYRGKGFAIPYDRLPIGVALILLAMAAGVLASGNEKMANEVATMAYYLLVLGVVLQIINYIREQRGAKGDKGLRDKDSRGNNKNENHAAEEK